MLFHSRYVPGLITSDWLHIHTKQVQLDANSVIFINRTVNFIIIINIIIIIIVIIKGLLEAVARIKLSPLFLFNIEVILF